jgi:hypothetical protein
MRAVKLPGNNLSPECRQPIDACGVLESYRTFRNQWVKSYQSQSGQSIIPEQISYIPCHQAYPLSPWLLASLQSRLTTHHEDAIFI